MDTEILTAKRFENNVIKDNLKNLKKVIKKIFLNFVN